MSPSRSKAPAGAGCAVLLLFVLALADPVAAAGKNPDDRSTALAINELLYRDPAVSNLLIEVEVDQGVALLGGSVTDLVAKERARELAATVSGVRAIVDRIEVVPTFRPDRELAEAVSDALASHPATEAYQVEVTVEGQRATLTGRVDSGAERRLAGNLAKGVAGLEAVVNRLSVEPAESRPDTELENEIEAVLAWDALVDDDRIEVTVENGVVLLGGRVSSLARKERAVEQSWIAGVSAVDDSALAVDTGAGDPRLREREATSIDRPDSAVAEALRRALARDPRVADEYIDVEVHGGKAILSGRVPSLFARKSAAETARNTLGVLQVVDRIEVAGEGARPLQEKGQ